MDSIRDFEVLCTSCANYDTDLAASVEIGNDVGQFSRAAEFAQNPPECIPAHHIKGLSQVYEHRMQRRVLLPHFLLRI